MKSRAWAIPALVVLVCTTMGCGIPSEPSVARQAMAASTAPLTITAELDEPLEGASAQLTLTVTNVDNGDWDSDLRPDSRINGFQGATLTSKEPSLTRIFSTNATESVVSFTLVGSLSGSSREVFRGDISHRRNDGWYLASSGAEGVPFGENSAGDFNSPIDVQIMTSSRPAALVIALR